MDIRYSDHAKKRMKQRGITELEIEHVLAHPSYVMKSFEGRKVAEGTLNNRRIKVSFIDGETFIKIITIM